MRGLAGSFLARRMMASRLLLGSVAVTIVITAALTAALVSFAADGLPRAVPQQLGHSPSLAVTISISGDAGTVARDTRAVGASMRSAFGRVPYQLDRAVWSGPLTLPVAHPGRTVPITEAAALAGIAARATLLAGRWPGPPAPGRPVEAALPAAVAQRLGLAPGARLTLRDQSTGQRHRVRITGVFGPRDPGSPYWNIDPAGVSGVSVQDQFVTYGPLVVSPAAFGGAGFAISNASWVVLPDGAAINGSGILALAARVTRAVAYLRSANGLGGLGVRTGLPAALTALGQSLLVARSLLIMGIVEVLLMAGVALSLAARLLASHRDEESALLSSRGAARWQLAGPGLAEAAVLGVVAAGAGAVLGARLAATLLGSGPLHGTGLRAAGIPLGAWLAALAVLVLSTAVLLWPMVRPAPPGEARLRRGRQAVLAGAARAGADLSLLALAVIAVWELRTYSAVAHSPGGLGIDPVPVLAPALALAGLTLVPLRLLPALARTIDGLIRRTRRLSAALASWEISRRPIRQSGPVLLVILAVGTGSLALSQYQSSRTSAEDQAAFGVGTDVRVNIPGPLPLAASAAIARTRGVTAAMPVATAVTTAGEVIALDARQAGAAVLLRPDLSPVPLPRLWRMLRPAVRPSGLPLPGRPARLRVTASLAPGGVGRLGPATATFAIQDAGGIAYTVPAGTLPADGRLHGLTAVLSAARQARYPLRLLGVSLSYPLPPSGGRPLAAREAARPARLTITGLALGAGPRGAFGQPVTPGAALAAWRPAAVSADLVSLGTGILPPKGAARPVFAGWRRGTGGARTLSFQPGQSPAPGFLLHARLTAGSLAGTVTVTAAPPARVIPAIATRSFLAVSRVSVGSVVPIPLNGVNVAVKLVAAVRDFPTAAAGGAVIVDQATVQDLLASQRNAPLPVTQWWLRTAGGAVPHGLPHGSAVTSRVRVAAARLADPLSALPQVAALVIAAAAALLAAVGFSVSVAASLRARQTQRAVLSALGVDRAGQAAQLCLEQFMLSLPAAGAGMLAGAGLAHVLVPAVTLTAAATPPVPPVAVEVPVAWLLWLALAVAAIPVAAAAFTVLLRPDPAATLRAAQATA